MFFWFFSGVWLGIAVGMVIHGLLFPRIEHYDICPLCRDHMEEKLDKWA